MCQGTAPIGHGIRTQLTAPYYVYRVIFEPRDLPELRAKQYVWQLPKTEREVWVAPAPGQEAANSAGTFVSDLYHVAMWQAK